MIRGRMMLVCLALIAGPLLSGRGSNAARSEIAVTEAWMGQKVSLTVILYSPGPFSGSAVFEIPEVPETLILKQGNPTVGSETVDGESMITQRHVFSLYTQQTGEVEIQQFSINYESKETFLGDPVPRSAETDLVRFTSKRPPGAEDLEYVITSSTTTVAQSWTPTAVSDFEAGDVLSRSITREASDVSVMLFPPIQATEIDGIGIYPGDPEVVDQSVRGVSTARRIDTIQYQFKRGGQFAIPEFAATWWNPKTEELEQIVLEGLAITVAAPPEPPKPIDKSKLLWSTLLILAGLVMAGGILYPMVKKRYLVWQERRRSPEAVANRALVKACRKNEAKEAYAALMYWQRAVGADTGLSESLLQPADALSRYLFGKDESESGWNGSPLLAGFRAEVRRRNRRQARPRKGDNLPPLNP